MTTRPTAEHDRPPTAGDRAAHHAPRDLDGLFRDDALLDAAVAAAQHDVARHHRLLGRPIAVWRDGRVVEDVPAPADAGTVAPRGR